MPALLKRIPQKLGIGILAILLLCSFQKTTLGADADHIQCAGCKTAYFLMQDVVTGFKARHQMEIMPQRSGNKVASKLLEAEAIEFAFTCQPHDKLVKKFELDPEKVKNWTSVRIAKDPIVVVVNRQNPITSLSKSQITDLFSGRITNWRELGGPDQEVMLSYSDDTVTSGVLVVFREHTVGRDKEGKLRPLSDKAARFPGPKQRGAYVSQNPGGITFMGLNSYGERYGKMLTIDGIEPTSANIRNGSYPLAGTYYLVYDETRSNRVLPFLRYLASDEGTRLINQGFVADIEKRW